MSERVKEAIILMDVLPDAEQELALEVIRRMVLAWDPDFTRLTRGEQEDLMSAREDDELISHDDIDWD